MKNGKIRHLIPFMVIIYLKSLYLYISIYEVSGETLLASLLVLPSLCFLVSFSLPMEKSGRIRYLAILNMSLSIIFSMDLMYFKGANRLFSLYCLYFKNLTPGMASPIINKINLQQFLMFSDMPLMVYFLIKKTPPENPGIISPYKRAFGFVFWVSLTLMLLQFFYLDQTGRLRDYETHPLILSPIGNHIYDTGLYLSEKTPLPDEESGDEIKNWFYKNHKYLDASPGYGYLKGILKDKNLIIIHFESLESFVIGKEYYGREITPNLNALIKESLYFSRLHEQIGEGVSADCELMFNTGLYPSSRGSAFMSWGENEYFSLPGYLKRRDYQTMAIHGDRDTFWNRDVVYPNLGIENYIHEGLFQVKTASGLGILDQYLFQQAITEAEKTRGPFYSYVMTITSHTPFDLEEEYVLLDIPGDDRDVGYLKTIHYTDHYLGEFLRELKTKPYYMDTAIILFGDHEGIHKYHETDFEENSGLLPFLIYCPGIKPLEITSLGGQVDMLPTVLYLLGADRKVYENRIMGKNLLKGEEGYVILPNGQILGNPPDPDHLSRALYISDLILTTDYFSREGEEKYTKNGSCPREETAVWPKNP